MRAEKVRKGGSVHGEGNSREGNSREGNSLEGTAGRETAGKETAGRETAGRKTAGRETAGKETAGRETAGRKTAGREDRNHLAPGPRKKSKNKNVSQDFEKFRRKAGNFFSQQPCHPPSNCIHALV
jgi:hypothetical protein